MATSSQPPITISQPLLNSIPANLVPRFESTYIEYYNKYNAGRLATHQVPIEDYRADPLKYTISYGREIVDQSSIKIIEQKCPVEGGEILVRIFEPEKTKDDEGLRPVYVNFHGGGWVFGGLATDFEFCKRLCIELGVVAFDVDYRLAPEFKFPIPVDDCWTAFNWIRDHKASEFSLDLSRVAIGGCSAGGHLSAVIAHKCRDAQVPLAFQLLGVPVTDLHVFSPTGVLLPDQPYESYRELLHTQPLPAARMSYFHNHFLGCPRPESLGPEWIISPIRAQNFTGLAPALVVVAEVDVLKDEGEAYAAKMNAAGSKAEIWMIKGAPHTVMQMDGILEGGKEYNRVVVKALREVFEGKVLWEANS